MKVGESAFKLHEPVFEIKETHSTWLGCVLALQVIFSRIERNTPFIATKLASLTQV